MTTATNPAFFELLTSSYKRLLGGSDIFLNGLAFDTGCADSPRWLYEDAKACVLAHDIAADPLFIYANRAAQSLFEYRWDEMIGLPSRLSAEAPDRKERQRLLDAVAQHGFATGYSGVRVTKSGRRFRIEEGILWELRDESGLLQGTAASFNQWKFLD